jgi:hypothetical protein
MTYRDERGVEWDTAEEALADFLSDLPDLTEDETEEVFQFTSSESSAADNLKAISYGIVYSGNFLKFQHYPVPEEVEA